MNTLHLRAVSAALLGSALAFGAAAQGQQAPAAPASSPPVIRPLPPARTAEEKRDAATMPGDLRPENPVVPQIKLPLGRKTPATEPEKAAARRDRRPANGNEVDDSVARCRAQETVGARARCNDRLDALPPAPSR